MSVPELLIAAVVVAGFALAIGWARSVRANEVRARRDFLDGLTAAVKGTLVPGESPTIEFRISGRPAEFIFLRDETPRSFVAVSVTGLSPGALEILPDTCPDFLKRLLRVKDLDVGDPAFDRDFVVQANPESVAKTMFSVERRARLAGRVRHLLIFGSPRLELTRDTLVVGVDQRVEDTGTMLAVLRCAEPFVEALLEMSGAGSIRWGTSSSGVCPVCAMSLQEDITRCGRCETPHHADCWRYVGRCSVYGCRGRSA